MTNEMKLLRAFIEASGFDVEEVKSTTTPKFSIVKALFTDRFNQQTPVTTIDYKVTKKEDNYALSVNPKFTNEQRAGFMGREIECLTRRKEALLNEKTS